MKKKGSPIYGDERIDTNEALQSADFQNALLLSYFSNVPSFAGKDLFDETLRTLTKLTQSSFGFLLSTREKEHAYELVAWYDSKSELTESLVEPILNEYAQAIWSECKILKTTVIRNEKWVAPQSLPTAMERLSIETSLCTPIFLNESVSMVLGVCNNSSAYTDSDVQKMQAIANVLQSMHQNQRIKEELTYCQNELQKIEVQYLNLENSNTTMIWKSGVDGKCLYFNETWLQFTGRGLELEVGNGWAEGVHPDDLDYCMNTYVKSFQKRQPFKMEYRLRHASGEYKWLLDFGSPNYNHQGEFIGYIGHCFDITERKQSESILNESLQELNQANLNLGKRVEERTREILEISSFQKAILANAPFAILTTNENGFIQSINPAGEHLLGYIGEEILGKHDSLFLHVAHNAADWLWISRKGESIPVRITKNSIVCEDGKLQGYVLLLIDLTQEKLALESLRKSEAENRAIVDAVPDHMFRIRRDGTYLDSHSKQDSTLYVPKDQFIGKKIEEVLPTELAQQSMVYIAKAFASGKVEQFEYELGVNEKISYFENRIVSISDEEVLSIIRDITERRTVEKNWQEAIHQLSVLIQNLQAGTLFENESRHITLVNHTFCDLFNIPATPEQLVGLDCKMASEESKTMMKDPDGFLRRIDDVLQKGEIVINDELYLKDGRVLERDYIPIRINETLLGHFWQYRDITQRKAIEITMRMQSAAMESFALNIIITDTDGRIQWVNPAFTKLTGYSVEEAIGKKPGELLKSGMQDHSFYEDFWNTLKQKSVWSGEIINRRKDGSLYFEEETITPVLDSQGGIINYIAIKIDITERKGLYQELTDEKRRLASILKGTNVGTWEWDIKTDEVNVNDRWAEMLGYGLEQFAQVKMCYIRTIYHPDDLKQADELLNKHFHGQLDYYSFECRMKHKNGDWIWVLDRGRVNERDTDGKPLKMSGTLQDITEQKKAELELKWNRSFLELMSNSSPLGFLVVDNRNDDIIYFNKRFCQIWEIEHLQERMARGELKNNDIIPYCLPVLADVPAFAESCKPLQDESNRIIVEDEIDFTNNRTVRRFSTQIRGEQDEYFGRFYIFEDITKRKRIENDLMKARNEAEMANLAKSEFLSRMSHELRTPMNSILGFAQLLEMGELNIKQLKGVEHILNNGRHLLSLINEVLDISGIESGRQLLSPVPLAVAPLINELIDSIQVTANAHQVTVKLEDSVDNLLYVQADELRFKQVLINLMGNAIKYNKIGGTVSIKIALQESIILEEGKVRITIQDSGIGIRPDDVSKLFKPFERIGRDRTDTEGTGLGLMVVKKLTEAMGGSVGVESEENVGSTFWVELPISNVHILAPRKHEKTTIKNMHEKKYETTVLYIEDNLSNIELVEEIFTSYRPEYLLRTSMYGMQTLRLAKQLKPGLILLDLNLPDVQGVEVLKQLRTDPQTETIPVVVVSADAMPFQIEKLLDAGAIDYLTKPLDVVLFLKCIDLHAKKH